MKFSSQNVSHKFNNESASNKFGFKTNNFSSIMVDAQPVWVALKNTEEEYMKQYQKPIEPVEQKIETENSANLSDISSSLKETENEKNNVPTVKKEVEKLEKKTR